LVLVVVENCSGTICILRSCRIAAFKKGWSEPVDELYYMDATVLWGNGFFNSFTDRDTHNSAMHDMAVKAFFKSWALASAHACGL
jgi:hypothetical protein